MSSNISIITVISRSLREFFGIFVAAAVVGGSVHAEDALPRYAFTIVMINMNGVPDLVRLPDPANLKAGEVVDISLGDKRWEENFYFLIESSQKSDQSWKIQQRQVNCLVDPANSTLLNDWPNRVSEWRDLSFVGTNRYKGNLFLEQDLSRLTRDELEGYARKIGGPSLDKNLEIVSRLVNKPEGNSYHCKAEFRVSVANNASAPNPLDVTYRIAVDNF